MGRVGALSVIAGLIQRERSGRGSHFDAAQFETPNNMMGDLFAQESLTPGSVHPLGNASSRGAPWGCYPCEGDEEWCVITVRGDEEWRALRKAIGDPEWAQRSAYDSAAGRTLHRDEIDAELGQWTEKRDPRAAMEALQAAGIPAGIVAHPGHHIGDPQMAHRNYPKVCDQQGQGTLLLEGPAFLGTDLPEVIVTQAPWLGEHTREIASEQLGLSDEEIQRLIDEDVLEDPPESFAV